MKKPSTLSLVLGIGLAFGVFQSCWADGERKKLLGLPFGVPTTMSACPAALSEAKTPCWLGPPQKSLLDDTVGGPVHLPDQRAIPSWVDGADVRAVIDGSGVINVVMVMVALPNRKEIARSVEARFGKPVFSGPLGGSGHYTEWRSAEGSATMLCYQACTVSFRTVSATREVDEQMAKEEARRKARPVAP